MRTHRIPGRPGGVAAGHGPPALCTGSGATQLLRGLRVTNRARAAKPVFAQRDRRVYRRPTALAALYAGGRLGRADTWEPGRRFGTHHMLG